MASGGLAGGGLRSSRADLGSGYALLTLHIVRYAMVLQCAQGVSLELQGLEVVIGAQRTRIGSHVASMGNAYDLSPPRRDVPNVAYTGNDQGRKAVAPQESRDVGWESPQTDSSAPRDFLQTPALAYSEPISVLPPFRSGY